MKQEGIKLKVYVRKKRNNMKKLLLIIMTSICLSFGFTNEAYISNAADLIMSVNKSVTYPEAYEIAEHTWNATAETDLEYTYVLGIMMSESRFNVKARSNCGAMGLMQVMPSTFTAISTQHGLNYSVSDGYDIEKNIRVGVLFLDKLFRKYGHIDLVSAGYNGGPRAANHYRAGNYSYVPKQTMNYVRAVRKNEKYFSVVWRVDL